MTGTTLLRAAALGAGTGTRSMTPLATTAWAAATGRLQLNNRPLSYLAEPDVAGALALMAAGEIVVDKLGVLPARTTLAPLLGRMVWGALCGAVVAQSDQERVLPAAAIGAAAAAVSSFAPLRARLALTRAGIPDPVAAMLEDGITITLARRVTMRQAAWAE